jgi:hypothetical protein
MPRPFTTEMHALFRSVFKRSPASAPAAHISQQGGGKQRTGGGQPARR